MQFVNIAAELDSIGVEYQLASESEVKVCCPFHADGSPSLYINVEKHLCDCKSCSWSGTFLGYLAKKKGVLLSEVEFELREKYGQFGVKSIPPQRVHIAHQKIWEELLLLKELTNRGLTTEDIKRHKLGVERKRVTIPIMDEQGFCVNLRKYLPGADGDKKFRDEKGCGSEVRLHPISQLHYDEILLCGGEIKAISAIKHANPLHIGAISATGGEGRWDLKLSEKLHNKKKVYIAYDIDAAGKSAALRIAHQLAAYVDWLGIVELPLDETKYPHGGIDDFLVAGGKLEEVLDKTEEFVPPDLNDTEYEADVPKRFTSLTNLVVPENVGQRVTGDCVVSTVDTMPYSIPKKVKIECPKSIDWCQTCPMFALKTEDMVKDIHPENPAVLGMLDVNEGELHEKVKEACSIPKLCKVCRHETLEFQLADDTRISEHLEVTKRSDDKALVPAVIVSPKLQLNTPYVFVGRLYPHPKTNQTVLLISKLDKKKDSLDTFDPKATSHLEIFRPAKWTTESLGEKLDSIYSDLEANVTRIFERRQMHLVMDLTYHSPLFLTNILGKRLEKGWVEALIVGDSSQGKTECAQGLQEHYDLGGWLSCKSASFAGVLGGIQQINKRWFVTWGAMPLQDRRLLVFEELKGMPAEIIMKLTDVRSTGLAEISKIERQKTYARVRMLALSNPRSDRAVGTYNSGVQVIQELIGNLEDIRRFDMFYIARKEDVTEDVIGEQREHEHYYTSDICRALILWSWTVRKTRFEDEDHLLAKSREFGRMYSDNVPIYDRGGGRFKIARLAAALACRTFSCETPDEVYVRKCHVDYVCNFLSSIYNSESFGYDNYSVQQKKLEEIADEDKVLAAFNSLSAPRHIGNMFMQSNCVTLSHFETMTVCSRDESKMFLSLLLRSNCLRQGRGEEYYKTAAFVKFLKAGLSNNEIVDRPEYIEQENM